MLPHIAKGDFVWLDSALAPPLYHHQQQGRQQLALQQPDFPAVAARVLEIWPDPQRGGEHHILLLDDQGNKLELGSVELQRWAIRPMHPTSIQGVADLLQMAELHEASVLRILQLRFRQRIFNTLIGPRVLLTMFPQEGAEEDDEEDVHRWQRRLGQSPHCCLQRSPNIFSLGSDILKWMDEEKKEKQQQSRCCVVFTGESGAGKSESAKKMLHYLIKNSATSAAVNGENARIKQLEQKMNAATLLIEAFGNVKTAKSSNASKHGKYMELHFADNPTHINNNNNNNNNGLVISSAQVELFLLEKSRLVEVAAKASGERWNGNFHVFYTLLAGANAQQRLDLELTDCRCSSYRLLAASSNSRDFVDNERVGVVGGRCPMELADIVAAMRTLQFREAEIEAGWRLLAACLHLGNLRYKVQIIDGKECVDLTNDRLNIQRISRLLRVDEHYLLCALTKKPAIGCSTPNGTLFANESANLLGNRGEAEEHLMIEEAIDVRDQLITEIYGQLVDHVFKRINEALAATITTPGGRKMHKIATVGLLDFPGQENNIKFGNQFEQLCINYAAECIQQFYVRRIFKLEQAEYQAQGLADWEEPDGCLPFADNLPVLEMLAVHPLSVMSVLDDVSCAPPGPADDEQLLAKLHSAQAPNERFYQRPKSELVMEFAIRHYTGVVHYKAKGMVEKNRQHFPVQLQALIAASESKFLRRIFGLGIHERQQQQQNGESGRRRLKEHTQCTRIRRAMDSLMGRLERCERVQFVRCLKANDTQTEALFDAEVVLRQIRQFDLLSTAEMCRAGFPIQMDYAKFVQTYRPLVHGIPLPHLCHCGQAARFICQSIFGESVCIEHVQFGKSKMFLRTEQHRLLEALRHQMLRSSAIVVQKCLHSWAKRQQFQRLRAAATVLQKNWRALVQRRRFQKFVLGITRLQALVRAHQLVVRYQWLRANIVHLQAHCRAAQLRCQLRSLPTAVERQQAMTARFHSQMRSEGEPPALELHAAELDNFHSMESRDYGGIHLAINNNNNKSAMEREHLGQQLHQKSVDGQKVKTSSWEKFAIIHFQQCQTSPRHSRAMLGRSLLRHQKPVDELLALACWRRLLQLMGDLGEECQGGAAKGLTAVDGLSAAMPIVARIKTLFDGRECGNVAELRWLRAELLNQAPRIGGIEKSANGAPMVSNSKTARLLHRLLLGDGTESALQKIAFIIGSGICRPSLRDEICSQLCKQLNGNPSATSAHRGYTLLLLCASSFSPTKRLLPHLLHFVCRQAPTELYVQTVQKALNRTRRAGPRKEAPIQAELTAAAHLGTATLSIDVRLADQRTVVVLLDSQTTAGELCRLLAAQIGLKDTFGFGFFLSSGKNVVRSLGADAERMMDALAETSATAIANNGKQSGNGSSASFWQIFFRKEVFRPFEIEQECDSVALDLAYMQVVTGLHSGEYPCDKEEDLAMLAAQQHFVLTDGAPMETTDLEETLADYLPRKVINNKSELDLGPEDEQESKQKWLQLILHAHRKKILKNEQQAPPSVGQIKQQLVQFVANQWPMLFSRFFQVYKFSGPPLPYNQLMLAVNSHGIVLLDGRDENDQQQQQQQRILLEIPFIQLAAVRHGRSQHQGAEAVSLQLLNSQRYTFQSAQARQLAHMLSQLQQALRIQSSYAIAMRDHQDILVTGDLLILDATFGRQCEEANLGDRGLLDSMLLGAENTRTGLRIKVPVGVVHILACGHQKPGLDQLAPLLPANSSAEMTNDGIDGGEEAAFLHGNGPFYEYPAFYPAPPFSFPIFGSLPPAHTLEQFAVDNFRSQIDGQPTLECLMGGELTMAPLPAELWRHSCHPLRAPLLKRLAAVSEQVVQECLLSYSFILKYMGDQPSHPQQYFLEHSDLIFSAPLKFEILRDETYCQLMKQLTENPNPLSEERGWELMWLCLGLFPPSKGLRRELAQFLHSRFVPMAADCAIRLQKALSECGGCGESAAAATGSINCRRLPPHQAELEAIQHRQTQIYHKFHLPDGSQDTVELESWTRAKDLAIRIAGRLGLKSALGFALFVKLGEKVVCIPEQEHFFDFVHQLQDWARKNGRRRNGGTAGLGNFSYQVHFMRKLWLDVEPGENAREDLIFNYHQELPKYLRGYHKIDRNSAAHLAALILRAQTKDERQPPVQHLQHILHQLVPIDLLKAVSPNEWKKLISAELGRPAMPKCSADAKLAFLQKMAKEPTFGSAFFEVKQSADPTLCSKLLVAINKRGMSLYEQETKRHICTYAFEQISHWQPANTYLHITLDKGNRLLFETTLGHKLDDLFTSYIQTLIALQQQKQENKSMNEKKMPKQGLQHNRNLKATICHRECA